MYPLVYSLRRVGAGRSAGARAAGARAGALLTAALLAGCASPPEPREPSPAHLGSGVEAPAPDAGIPEPVRQAPILPAPEAAAPEETYTVVVDSVPVKELLFALARDAQKNVDIHPDVSGNVTLNAVDQTLTQILERISRQVDLRYEMHGDTLVVSPDLPYLKRYKVDYVNLSRDSTSTVGVSTQISTTGMAEGSAGSSGGGQGRSGTGDNNSTTQIESTSNNRFWNTLAHTVRAILEKSTEAPTDTASGSAGAGGNDVIVNPEGGLLLVRATERQHEQVQAYLDQLMASVKRQVVIEATVVEVELNDRYRTGIDFSKALGGGGIVSQSLLGPNLATAPFFLLELANAPEGSPDRDISLTVRLLKEFGDTRVLSSPKLMVLNNQTALLKVVNNVVYFRIRTEVVPGTVNQNPFESKESTPQTVPVGFVMSVTPQVNETGTVTVNVRPTISRISRFVDDPANPGNEVPEIQVREMESVLKLQSGQIAILGGLMQDENIKSTDGVPGVSELPGIGEAFKFRDNDFTKTELVIFLRPTVVESPSVEADLQEFRRFLPANLERAEPLSGVPAGGEHP